MVDSDQVTPVLYSAFLVFGTRGEGSRVCSVHLVTRSSRRQNRFYSYTRRKSRIGGRKKGRQGSKSSHTKVAKGKKRAQEGERDVGVLLLVRLPWGKQRSPLESGVSVLLGLSSLFPCFQFLLEMEGTATAGPELGLFRCLLCAWETPSRLAVLQHLRAPAHRDAQAQRRLQLLQSGPAADEGLPALQSILSFSHGQLRPHGEEEGTGEEGKGGPGGSGGPRREWRRDEKRVCVQSRASGKVP